MPHEVFISYSTKDDEIANKVCRYLEERGITCWIAWRDASPGRDWAESIVNAILDCKLMLLIFSANSNDSPQINREINLAAEEGVPILPFRIENIRPSTKLRYYLSTPHWLDALPPPNENHFMRLVNSINNFLFTDAPAEAPLLPEKIVDISTPQTERPADESESLVEASNQFQPEIRPSQPNVSMVRSAFQSRIRKLLSSLFTFNDFIVTEDAKKKTFFSEKKVAKLTGIVATLWLVAFALIISIDEPASRPLYQKVGIALICISGSFASLIPGWILAYVAKTHLIFGSISGTLTYTSLVTFALVMDYLRVSNESGSAVVFILGLIISLIMLIGFLRQIPIFWIWCGLLSLFYLLNGIFNNFARFTFFFGVFGIGLLVFAIVRTRRLHETNNEALNS